MDNIKNSHDEAAVIIVQTPPLLVVSPSRRGWGVAQVVRRN